MREFTAQEIDALVEICNIGMGRAAKQLSNLLKEEVHMSVPNLSILPLYNVVDVLTNNRDEQFACVLQNVSGKWDGYSLLVFQKQDTDVLLSSFVSTIEGDSPNSAKILQDEAMIEIGNIIISACFSAIHETLQTASELSIPTHIEGTLETVVRNCNIKYLSEDPLQAVVFTAILEASRRDITSTLLMVYPQDTIDDLIKQIDLLMQPPVDRSACDVNGVNI